MMEFFESFVTSYGQKKPSRPKKFHAVVSAHVYTDEKGYKHAEVLNSVDTDEDCCGIFEDLEYTVRDNIDLQGKEERYVFVHVSSWFETYMDPEYGPQSDVEVEVTEFDSIKGLGQVLVNIWTGGWE